MTARVVDPVRRGEFGLRRAVPASGSSGVCGVRGRSARYPRPWRAGLLGRGGVGR